MRERTDRAYVYVLKSCSTNDKLKLSGLVALYDIRPGNGADLLLQCQSLHGGAGQETLNHFTVVTS